MSEETRLQEELELGKELEKNGSEFTLFRVERSRKYGSQ